MLHYSMGKLDKCKIRAMVTDNPTMTLQEVADCFGCTREYVRQLAGHLRDLLVVRQVKSILRRKKIKDRIALDSNLPAKYLLDKGLDVEFIPMPGTKIRYMSKRFKVNGVVCFVYMCQGTFSTGRGSAKYAHFSLNSHKSLNVILVVNIPGYPQKTYILPKNFSGTPGSVYINLDPRPTPYNNVKSIYDWTKYEDAWHLLGK